MLDSEILEHIKEQVASRGYRFIVSLARNTKPPTIALKNYIIASTQFMDEQKSDPSYEYSLSERVWMLIHDKKEFPQCLKCKHPLDDPKNFVSLKDGFRQYCSLECAITSDLRTQHIMQTNLDKTGYTSNFSNPAVQKQIQETNANKTPEQKQERLDKIRNTRYSNNDGKWHADDFVSKCKATLETKHGDPNWHNVELTKQTLLENYGVTCSFNIPSVEEKSAIAIKQRSYEKFILGSEYDIPLFSFEEYCTQHDNMHRFKFQCKKCGTVFESIHRNGVHKKCPKCYPKLEGTSYEEKEVQDFICSLVKDPSEIQLNSRTIITPQELDVYIPSKSIAFEFDGLYWHSEKENPNPNYHLEKTEKCAARGIQLVHIFEDEWLWKNAIAKSCIKEFLEVHDTKISSEQCIVKDVAEDIALEFLEENHILGPVAARVRIGLYHQDQLVSLMTFSSTHVGLHSDWELLRFCNKLNCEVDGAFSKLLRRFEESCKPKSVRVFVDRRWSSGLQLENAGFCLEKVEQPSYWYVVEDQMRASGAKYQKENQQALLEKFDPAKSEEENMKANNYYRIFDCGNLVLVKKYAQQ